MASTRFPIALGCAMIRACGEVAVLQIRMARNWASFACAMLNPCVISTPSAAAPVAVPPEAKRRAPEQTAAE